MMKIIKQVVYYIWYGFVLCGMVTCGEGLFFNSSYTAYPYSVVMKIMTGVVYGCGVIFTWQVWHEKHPIKPIRLFRFSPYCKYCGEKIGYFGKYDTHCCGKEEEHIDEII